MLVSLLYRACYGSLVLASCLLTTLAALMVVCGKLRLCPPFWCVCVCVRHIHLVLVLIDGVDQKEAGAREEEGSGPLWFSLTSI